MRKHSLIGRVMIGIMLVVSGCHIPSLHYADPSPNLPSDYNGVTTGDNSARLGINEFFNDPVLTRLITQGLTQNQEFKIRNQEVLVANYEIMARRGAYLPFVNLSARGGFERTSKYTPLGAAEEHLTAPGGVGFSDPLGNVRIAADLFWRVDLWKEFRNARKAAEQRYCAAIEARDYFVTRLVEEIAESYYELAALDKRLEFLNQTIEIQERSLEVAKAQKEAARGTELAVQRFQAEVRKNESQKLIVQQQILEAENRINFLVGRYPQPVERVSWDFISLDSQRLAVGVPAELLLNRRDIRAAEREVAASGLDILVARARFFPRLDITASVGFEAFNPRYLFDPGAFIASTAGELVAPIINRAAIKADYLTANARQIQAVFDYQRTVLNAYTEVINLMAKVENYRRSVEFKQAQVESLEESVNVATDLFQSARAEYVDVLFSQRDLLEARTSLIETKQEQLSAIVNAYQALGGGFLLSTSGQGISEIYCPPLELNPADLIVPPPPAAPDDQPTPDNATPSPTPADESELPPPVDVTPQTAPDEAIPAPLPAEEQELASPIKHNPKPAQGKDTPQPAPGDESPQSPSQATLMSPVSSHVLELPPWTEAVLKEPRGHETLYRLHSVE